MMLLPHERISGTSVFFLAGMIGCMTIAQVMFKYAGNHVAAQFGMLEIFISNPWLWAGLLSSGTGMVCWMLALRKLSLASAYPWTALIYVFTPFASLVLFGDVLTGRYLAGMGCIVVGVFIAAGGVESR